MSNTRIDLQQSNVNIKHTVTQNIGDTEIIGEYDENDRLIRKIEKEYEYGGTLPTIYESIYIYNSNGTLQSEHITEYDKDTKKISRAGILIYDSAGQLISKTIFNYYPYTVDTDPSLLLSEDVLIYNSNGALLSSTTKSYDFDSQLSYERAYIYDNNKLISSSLKSYRNTQLETLEESEYIYDSNNILRYKINKQYGPNRQQLKEIKYMHNGLLRVTGKIVREYGQDGQLLSENQIIYSGNSQLQSTISDTLSQSTNLFDNSTAETYLGANNSTEEQINTRITHDVA